MRTFLQSHWKAVLAVNLVLGAFLWFLDSTDFSLRGSIPDIVFPPFVFIVAITTMMIVPDTQWKRVSKLFCLPSLIGAGVHVLFGIIMIIPPFTLAFLFGIDEIMSEVRIQQISSPNNKQVAEVYFRPVGAYSGGNGRIYVQVTDKFLPFLEREILYLRVSHADENTENYLKWTDNNTLYISEINEKIPVGTAKFEIPYAVAVPLNIVQFLIAIGTN